MARKLIALVVVGLLVVGGVAFALATGFGPAPGGDADSTEAFPTATSGAADDGGSGDDTAGTETAVDNPFAVVIENTETCGDTCSDVTVSLTNRQSVDATGVTAYTRVFAGNSTDASDEVWRGSEDIGTLAAGETYTTTKRVELSYSEAFAVQQADGWVTIQTTIQTDDRTITFSERENVA